ncbi:CDP-diacylglycerol--glycerol-3-phosphate 3-phosphatidyltransferase [Arachnia propionica]|uniref:CDP-diacylglycerol--glycerol-3-phosphate 3-phosphatidyltransferase n=1 Tax=Arachnia propionica TaxID=1750 RepID=A0A3P1T3G4_9ACTN|nr:CDP-diacylglycerol--glycerol-3-phosphate 3-phosphatidyltransferase [Arachnia propionica]MDO5083124.1 CDP-diacylglycerol--glycerol-3-phosphate 3-phosphatidyltransferase [Arachnia propionica]RRD03909.1 CDP-diacylglycerol--glycerol-3-phosphate 3-phosphatidyltransferase [Arachnia propionica]
MTESPPSNWNVPNALTVLRIVMVPIFLVVLFLHPHDPSWRLAATGVFTLAILTDLADGAIARRWNLVTDFGKLWDPFADKALTGAAFISLSVLGELPWFFTVLILLREWSITWLRAAVAKYGIMAAKGGGKLKTVVQSLALILFLRWLEVLPGWFQVLAWVLMWAALALTLMTGLDYVREALRLRRQARGKGETAPVE